MKYFYVIIIFSIVGCSPKIVINYVNQSYPMVKTYESFGITRSDTFATNPENFIGKIIIKENGISINCDYWTVMEQLKNEARKAGGNLIKIDDHKKPSKMGSTCHQIAASIFRIPDPRPYEEIIIWHQNRKLNMEDFKASTENRPFQASSTSGIEYHIKPLSSKGGFNITVRSQFHCFESYFKHSDDNLYVLAHEQLHFDITEIYARKFFKELVEAELNPYDFNNQANEILNKISSELSLKQDEYDSEVYVNPNLMEKWEKWVNDELENLKEFEKKEISNTVANSK